MTTTKRESLKSDKAPPPLPASIQPAIADASPVKNGVDENTAGSNTTWSEIREKEWQRNVAQLQSYISSLESRCDEKAGEQDTDEEEITDPSDSPYQPFS